MKLIICVDQKYGYSFNKRRQASDSAVTEKILSLTENSILWSNSYSSKLFPNAKQLEISEIPLSEAGKGEYCFVENIPFIHYLRWVDCVVLFRWDRIYPSELQLDINLSNEDVWKCTHYEEFPGSSHEKITMEIYERVIQQ